MDFLKLNNHSIDFFKSALDFKARRMNLVASNIANADTPKYKSVDIEFEDQMNQVLKASQEKGLTLTNAKHLNGAVSNLDQVNPEFIIDDSPGRLDGNNVDLDSEMAKLSETGITYNAVAQIIRRKFEGLKFAIESGG